MWFKFYMYDKYIKNLAPHFTWGGTFLSPHAIQGLDALRSLFAFDWLPPYQITLFSNGNVKI